MPARALPTIFLLVLWGAVGVFPAWGQEQEILLDVAQKKVRAFNIQTVTATGRGFQLRRLRGQVVFLNFWATWCVPCRLEMPSMERLHQKMEGRPFAVVAVNLQEPEILVKKFAEDLGLTFTILMDADGEIGENYHASNLPVTYIIDKKGYVVRRAIGPREWDGPAALKLFEQLMAEE